LETGTGVEHSEHVIELAAWLVNRDALRDDGQRASAGTVDDPF
jgi:hypothetical protein